MNILNINLFFKENFSEFQSSYINTDYSTVSLERFETLISCIENEDLYQFFINTAKNKEVLLFKNANSEIFELEVYYKDDQKFISPLDLEINLSNIPSLEIMKKFLNVLLVNIQNIDLAKYIYSTYINSEKARAFDIKNLESTFIELLKIVSNQIAFENLDENTKKEYLEKIALLLNFVSLYKSRVKEEFQIDEDTYEAMLSKISYMFALANQKISFDSFYEHYGLTSDQLEQISEEIDEVFVSNYIRDDFEKANQILMFFRLLLKNIAVIFAEMPLVDILAVRNDTLIQFFPMAEVIDSKAQKIFDKYTVTDLNMEILTDEEKSVIFINEDEYFTLIDKSTNSPYLGMYSKLFRSFLVLEIKELAIIHPSTEDFSIVRSVALKEDLRVLLDVDGDDVEFPKLRLEVEGFIISKSLPENHIDFFFTEKPENFEKNYNIDFQNKYIITASSKVDSDINWYVIRYGENYLIFPILIIQGVVNIVIRLRENVELLLVDKDIHQMPEEKQASVNKYLLEAIEK